MPTAAPLVLALLLAGAAAPIRAQATPPAGSPDSAAVLATVAAFHAALARGDSAAALELLAPDLLVLESGGLETRAEYAAHHLGADMAFVQAVPSTRIAGQVRIEGTTAWAASLEHTVGTFQGRPVNSQGAELMVLTRSGGRWTIRAIHWSSRRR